MAKFEPTDEQREDVAIMASAGRLSQEDIAKSIINPRTGRPITVKTLCRVFKKELSEDVEFKKLILQKFKEEVSANNWQAIKYGMDYVVGFADGTATATASGPGEMKGITVRFVKSSHSDAPIDITPVPALPPPPEPLPAQKPPDPSPTSSMIPAIHCGKYRTEMDDPEVTTPWHKKKLTGKLATGPSVWGRNKPK